MDTKQSGGGTKAVVLEEDSFHVDILRTHPHGSSSPRRTKMLVPNDMKISDLKFSYLKESPKRDWIQLDLRLQGSVEPLRDDLLVRSAVPNGSTLTYESVVMTPERSPRTQATRIPPFSLGPTSLEDKLAAAEKEKHSAEFIASEGNVFKKEGARALVVSTGARRPVGDGKSMGSETSSESPKNRTTLCRLSVRVRNCVFDVVHRMEGFWSGECAETVANFCNNREAPKMKSSKVTVSTSSLMFSRDQQCWIAKRRQTTKDGIVDEVTFFLVPVDHGLLKSEKSGVMCRMEEMRNGTVAFTGVNEQGRLLFVETITMTDEDHRVRTSQTFDQTTGIFVSAHTILELRQYDSKTGAIVPKRAE